MASLRFCFPSPVYGCIKIILMHILRIFHRDFLFKGRRAKVLITGCTSSHEPAFTYGPSRQWAVWRLCVNQPIELKDGANDMIEGTCRRRFGDEGRVRAELVTPQAGQCNIQETLNAAAG